jgi:DNA invertase Pin-like site-specific DNA recombinase
MQAIRSAPGARARSAALLLVAAIALALACAESAAASTAYSAASAKPRPVPWTGWNGRPIERPHQPVGNALPKDVAFPAGWSAGAVRYGTGYHRLGASERVREVQRRLTRLGYHTGPVDGLYGPLTRSSVQWFQIKHGLRPTGVVAATTLAALRNPKGFVRQLTAEAKRPSGQPSVTRHATPEKRPAGPAHHGAPTWLVVALAALAIALVLQALVLSVVKARSARRPQPRVLPPTPAANPAPADPDRGAPVLGYVTGEPGRAAAEHEEAIREVCRRRGWTLARLVRDARNGSTRPLSRPGLSYAVEQLTQGAASRLVVHKLEHVARSLPELRVVLGWFMRTGVALMALDVGLDTGTPEGRTAVRALLSVSEAERTKVAAQTRNGLAAAKAAARPAVADIPELAGRIRQMRASGMTLQAIADTLNREGVPTVRGGAEWRPSSVQSVLGYRRAQIPEW